MTPNFLWNLFRAIHGQVINTKQAVVMKNLDLLKCYKPTDAKINFCKAPQIPIRT